MLFSGKFVTICFSCIKPPSKISALTGQGAACSVRRTFPKDAAQVFIYPPLYFQCVRLTTFTWIWMIPNCCKCRTPFFAQRFART